MNHKIILTLCAFMIFTISNVEANRKINHCTMDTFFTCLIVPIARFTHQFNGTGIPKDDAEFEEFCTAFHDIQPYCIRKYAERCGTPVWKEIFNQLWIKRLQEGYEKFCDRNQPQRTAFVKHATCLIEKVKLSENYRKECVRDFQANNEYIQQELMKKKDKKGTLTQYFRSTCCAYNDWENCIVRHLNEQCGEDASESFTAGEIFPYLINYSSILFPKQLCVASRYNAKSPTNECRKEEYLAPKNYIPKGLKSNSFASYFFSVSCPNVGYGVDPSRDV